MDVDITIKNYRCFPDTRPARISVRNGFTAFVGVNNSGKSSLLKFFYEFRNLFQVLLEPGNLVEALRGTRAFKFGPSVVDPAEVFSNGNSRDLEVELRFTGADNPDKKDGTPVPDLLVVTIPRGTNIWSAQIHLRDRPVDIGDMNSLSHSETQLLSGGAAVAELSHLFDVSKTLANTLYIGPFRNAINVGTKEDYFDIRVGEAFIHMWRTYKTGKLKSQVQSALGVTDDIRRIFDFRTLEINTSDDNETLQVIVNGKSYRLVELGSGLAQFTLVLVNAAIEKPAFILIDEPELNLHPSLQLDFLTTLTSYAGEGILFATHSVGLARAGADWVYSVRKIQEGESQVSEYESTPRLSEFLGELSFSEYKELGCNRVLLVEGATDVKTVQQFLRHDRKDHEVVLLPLGGAQLINKSSEAQLQEIKRISGKVAALIDSERTSKGAPLARDREGFVEICKNAKIKCHVLERRAIENYLTDEAVKKVKDKKYRALEPYEVLADVNPAWSKSENWRIARAMGPDGLRGTDLGRFLNSL